MSRLWMSAKQAERVWGLSKQAIRVGEERGILRTTRDFCGVKLYHNTELCELKHRLGKPYVVQWVDCLEGQDAESIYREVSVRSPGSVSLFVTDYFDDFKVKDSVRGWVRLEEGDVIVWADGVLTVIPYRLWLVLVRIFPLLLRLEEVEPGIYSTRRDEEV